MQHEQVAQEDPYENAAQPAQGRRFEQRAQPGGRGRRARRERDEHQPGQHRVNASFATAASAPGGVSCNGPASGVDANARTTPAAAHTVPGWRAQRCSSADRAVQPVGDGIGTASTASAMPAANHARCSGIQKPARDGTPGTARTSAVIISPATAAGQHHSCARGRRRASAGAASGSAA